MAPMDLQSFKSVFRGQMLEPEDAGYNGARKIWNASIDKRPRLIARCSGIADVVDAVNFGRTNRLLTAVRGGGHNVRWSATEYVWHGAGDPDLSGGGSHRHAQRLRGSLRLGARSVTVGAAERAHFYLLE